MALGSKVQIDDKTKSENQFPQLKAASSRECSGKRNSSINGRQENISGVIQNSSSKPKQLGIPTVQMDDDDTKQSSINERKAEFFSASKEGGTNKKKTLPFAH